MALRTYGRTFDVNGNSNWTTVTTDANGFDDLVWVVTLIQNLQGILGESPFHADAGIPAVPSVLTQIPPDFYVANIQARFAQYFASLMIYREKITQTTAQVPPPTYRVNVITKQGAILPPVSVPTQIPR